MAGSAQILVGVGGAGPITFPAEPPLVVTEWATQDNILPGDAATYTTPGDVDGAAQLINASAIVTALTRSTAAGTARVARHNTNGTYVYTQPTGVPVAVLKATLRNDTGGDVTAITVSYNYSIVATPVTDSAPGQRVFYSTDGVAGNWQLLPAFSGQTAAALLSAGITFGTPWAAGTDIFLMWVDDNNQSGNDGGFAIDNFAVAIGLPPCPGITNNPSSLTITQCVVNAVSFTVGTTGSVASVQWERDSGGGFAAIPGANSLTYTLTPVGLGDSGSQFRAIVSGGGTCTPLTSGAATLTVNADTTGPIPLYALGNANLTNITVVFNENINTNVPSPQDVIGNYTLVDTNTSAAVAILTAIPLGNSRGYLLETDPLDPSHGYELILAATVDACADNPMSDVTIPVYTYISQPLGLTAPWRYLDNDVDPGAGWEQTAFDDSSWFLATGVFDAKRNAGGPGIDCRPGNVLNQYFTNIISPTPMNCIRLISPVTQTNLITANFRAHFNYAGNTNATILEVTRKLDDGGIIYLNGVEILRDGMAAGAVTRTTFATRTVGDGDQPDVTVLNSPASLRQGDNVIAVELHQQNLGSSDLTMGLMLRAYTLNQLCAAGSLSIVQAGPNVTVTWSGGAVLQQSTDISSPANWSNVPGAPTSPYTTAANGSARFYRVVCP